MFLLETWAKPSCLENPLWFWIWISEIYLFSFRNLHSMASQIITTERSRWNTDTKQKVLITTSSGETIRSKCFLSLPFFNFETAVGSSNNCRLAVGGFLWGERLQRKSFQVVPLQMFFFPKARSLCFIVFAAPVFPPVLRLFWGTICVLGPGFICWCSAKGRRGCQMKPINHLTDYKR